MIIAAFKGGCPSREGGQEKKLKKIMGRKKGIETSKTRGDLSKSRSGTERVTSRKSGKVTLPAM